MFSQTNLDDYDMRLEKAGNPRPLVLSLIGVWLSTLRNIPEGRGLPEEMPGHLT
jgi:hypothetical protein